MERIHGHPIGRNWLRTSVASRHKILGSLKEMILQMRTLHPENTLVSSVNGGSLYDPRMPCSTGRFGPFNNVQEFHDYLRNGIQAHSNHNAGLAKLINLHSQDWSGLTFTHGDLSSLDILVRGEEVVGIVDWETAGWYPSYWEYTAAC
ncbi:kinase-like protein [Acrodontium crateriforme]|uniref:Kinase-like protein n=1 Tax=Acrodontium crateriforme TaxID=150365 RepID=A0AAQ3R9V4_9PEZI|nr:kinase-like protein [Acrodontium crateriforme]